MREILNVAVSFVLSRLLPASIWLIAGLAVIRFIMTITEKLLIRSHMEKVACGLIKTVVRVVFYGILMLVVASKLGVDITGVVALVSVLTLAISLSVQNALTNLISGFTLLYTKPFVAGDFVEIAGQSGSVQAIDLTYTKLATADNKSVFIPNGTVTAGQIVNYTELGSRRIEIFVAASYDSSPSAVLEALLEAAKIEGVLDTPRPFAGVTDYDESAVRYVLHVWAKSQDYWPIRFKINLRLPEMFREKGVCMTYPHLHVHLDKQ